MNTTCCYFSFFKNTLNYCIHISTFKLVPCCMFPTCWSFVSVIKIICKINPAYVLPMLDKCKRSLKNLKEFYNVFRFSLPMEFLCHVWLNVVQQFCKQKPSLFLVMMDIFKITGWVLIHCLQLDCYFVNFVYTPKQ